MGEVEWSILNVVRHDLSKKKDQLRGLVKQTVEAKKVYVEARTELEKHLKDLVSLAAFLDQHTKNQEYLRDTENVIDHVMVEESGDLDSLLYD